MPSSTHGFFLSLEESPTKETAVAQAFGAYLQDFSANVSFGSQIYCHNEEASSQGRLRLSLSLRLCLRFCLPRQNISTIHFFISGFCSNPFSFLLLLFPEIIVAFLPNSLLSLRVNHYSVPFFLFLLFFSNI